MLPSEISLLRYKKRALKLVKQVGTNIYSATIDGSQRLDLLVVDARVRIEKELGKEFGLLLVYHPHHPAVFSPSSSALVSPSAAAATSQEVVVYNLKRDCITDLYKRAGSNIDMMTLTGHVIVNALEQVARCSNLIVHYAGPDVGWKFTEVMLPADLAHKMSSVIRLPPFLLKNTVNTTTTTTTTNNHHHHPPAAAAAAAKCSDFSDNEDDSEEEVRRCYKKKNEAYTVLVFIMHFIYTWILPMIFNRYTVTLVAIYWGTHNFWGYIMSWVVMVVNMWNYALSWFSWLTWLI